MQRLFGTHVGWQAGRSAKRFSPTAVESKAFFSISCAEEITGLMRLVERIAGSLTLVDKPTETPKAKWGVDLP